MKRMLFILLGLILIGSGLYFVYTPRRGPNLLLIVVDTLRADHMGIYGYERATTPRLDEFARENIKFNFAVSAAPWTPASMASIFTGLYPSAHGMMPPNSRAEASKTSTRLTEGVVTLAEALREKGYTTVGVSTNPWLTKTFGFDQGFEIFRDIKRQSNADAVTAEAKRLLEDLRKGDKPFFLWLHYMDPHNPYAPPAEYREMYSGPLKRRDYPEKQLKNIGLYDGEIRHTDVWLGDLLDYLKQTELYEDLVIVFTADHGEQFMERGHQGHGYNLHNEETHVPLLVRVGSGTQAREVNSVVSTVDIFPSLLSMAGLTLDRPVQGVEFFKTEKSDSREGVLSELRRRSNFKSVVDPGGQKLIVDYGMDAGLVVDPELAPITSSVFDSREDYLELSAIEDSSLSIELDRKLKDVYRQTLALRLKDVGGEIEMDEKTIEDLKSLGYLQ